MDRHTYDEYLRRFNDRDYDGLLEFWNDDLFLAFAGGEAASKAEIRSFYRLFHAHVDESIAIRRFLSDASTIALEADVRIEGRVDLTTAMVREAGFPMLSPVVAGDVLVIPQFIHYHLKDGKFSKAWCVVAEPPTFSRVR